MRYYNLSDKQTKFLNEYRPQDMGFTSLKEMEKNQVHTWNRHYR